MTPTIVDNVNEDGTVQRVTTMNFPNGDSDVRTHTFTADQYQEIQTQLQNQINDLQSQLTTTTANVTTVQTNLAKLKTTTTPAQ